MIGHIKFPENLKDICPFKDPKCIAKHSESEYCMYQSEGVPVPEAESALPAVESPEGVDKPTITIQGSPTGKQTQYLFWPRIRGCGHKFRHQQQPSHRNCKNCWFTYFYHQNVLTENLAKNISEGNLKAVLYTHGKKFLTHFLTFAKTLAEYEHFKQTMGGV